MSHPASQRPAGRPPLHLTLKLPALIPQQAPTQQAEITPEEQVWALAAVILKPCADLAQALTKLNFYRGPGLTAPEPYVFRGNFSILLSSTRYLFPGPHVTEIIPLDFSIYLSVHILSCEHPGTTFLGACSFYLHTIPAL